jgi:nicotinate-nucleotide pyrophosphorylase (carboxylating)
MNIRLSDYAAQVEDLVEKSLEEDMPRGDITTDSLITRHTTTRANLLAEANGLLAGIGIARMVFLKVDPFLKFSAIM